ncbi:MAG: DUF4199 domain-containing protein [Bacteroidia bacterium]|jgi:uncharacterized membrane protein (DUF485 family)
MEAQKANMFKQAMTDGLYISAISIGISVLIWATSLMEKMGLFGSAFIGIIQLVLLVYLLIFFTKKYRNEMLSGKITFSQAFTFGVLLVVLSSVVTSLYSYIFNKFIDPEYASRIMTMMQDKTYQFMSSKGVPEDQIESAMKKFEEKGIPSPLETLTASLQFGLIGGVFMSLISSAIVKKNINSEDAFDDAMGDVKTEE